MALEPFDPTSLRTDSLTDARGKPIGRLVASRYDTEGDRVKALVVELAEEIRTERLLADKRVQVPAEEVRIENGAPRLTLTLDEFLESANVSYSESETPPQKPDRRPDHFGAAANPTKEPGTGTGRRG